ncbi:MAG: S1C family serine protease [Acidimicrobiia bacterium]
MRRVVMVVMAAGLLVSACSSGTPTGARDVVQEVANGVVTVTKTGIQTFVDEDGVVVDSKEAPVGTGSGVVVDDAGHIVTNAHVVQDAVSVFVVGIDGVERPATVIATISDGNDLAVLRVDGADGLEPVEVGSSLDMYVGDPVVAVGNPLGLGLTVTVGVLSAVDRSIRTEFSELHGILQTDAAINPGNSGGPLLNGDGDLVGINSAGINDAENIGFAIPVEQAISFVEQAIASDS